MDYKSKLIKIVDYVNVQEENYVVNLADKKETFLDSYDNWTFKDVVSHISEWMILSSNKLKSVKNNEYVSFHENLDVTNRHNYYRHKNESIEEIRLLFMNSNNLLKKQIESFDNSELISEGKIDGFKSALWKYILIDGFLHPIVHMVFYYIKIQEFESAFKMLQNSYVLLLELDNSEETIADFFSIGEIFEELDEMVNKDAIISNLKAFYKRNKTSETISSVVLDHFMTMNNI